MAKIHPTKMYSTKLLENHHVVIAEIETEVGIVAVVEIVAE